MRIISEFDLEEIKVTVFKMNEKVSVKFEYNLLEQTYKFRDGSGINSKEDVKLFCDITTVNSVKFIFKEMADTRSTAIQNIQPFKNEFDVII